MLNTPYWVIKKKRDGKELQKEELRDFIRGISSGVVTDYQVSAFLMAVYCRGMTLNEIITLTELMLESGDRYDFSQVRGPKVDKHSTGGVGDKVSLILAPLAAACGLKVPMMSGRGLGNSGGTLDKLESIPGFRVNLDRDQFRQILAKVGCAMTGQTERIAPIDKKLYAIRDVTATVECIPLIVASILSKKLAEGTDALVLDVKVGSGAFMKTLSEGQRLAKTLVLVAKKLKMPSRAILTQMSQPLGYAVGNALEVRESIEILKNEKSSDLCSADLKELTIQLCAHMLVLGKRVTNISEGRKLAHSKLADGSAWKVFLELVEAQGGNKAKVLQPHLISVAPQQVAWKAKRRGYISKMETENFGRILVELGGGRKKAADRVDPSVGLIFHKKLGSKVDAGEPIATVYAQNQTDLGPVEALFQESISITGARKAVPKLILGQY